MSTILLKNGTVFDGESYRSGDILISDGKIASRMGLRVMVHTTNTPVPMAELLDVLGPGDIATHVYHGMEHNLRADDFACIHHAKARGVIIDTGFAGSWHVDFGIFADAVAA